MLKKDTQFRVFLLRVLMVQKENMVNTLWMQVALIGVQLEKMTSQYQVPFLSKFAGIANLKSNPANNVHTDMYHLFCCCQSWTFCRAGG